MIGDWEWRTELFRPAAALHDDEANKQVRMGGYGTLAHVYAAYRFGQGLERVRPDQQRVRQEIRTVRDYATPEANCLSAFATVRNKDPK
jgi:hypothetical protein